MTHHKDDEVALHAEQRKWVADSLRKAGLDVSLEPDLTSLVQGTIAVFLADRAASSGTDRERHDALRRLWSLAHSDDPPVGIIRGLVARLPKRALDYIDLRAVNLISRLFPGQSVAGGFQAWARDAAGSDLVKAIGALCAEGGRIVPGRSRGRGKRSEPALEPMILGQVRGSGDTGPSGGRPRHDEQDSLVQNLAVDWLRATGRLPQSGRSDHTGFGELVHGVFDWADEPGAMQALRRYWVAMKSAKTRPVLSNGIEFI
jgi:hypothetical protein